jgi:hypothetical protein
MKMVFIKILLNNYHSVKITSIMSFRTTVRGERSDFYGENRFFVVIGTPLNDMLTVFGKHFRKLLIDISDFVPAGFFCQI